MRRFTSKYVDMAVDETGQGMDTGRIARNLIDQGEPTAAPEAPERRHEIGPDQEFAPRPYPRREAGASPLRGCRVLVIDGDVLRGRAQAVHLSARAAASRHHSGGEGLGELLDGRDTFDIILVAGAQVDDEDIKALGSVQGEPSVVLIGDSARAESLGLQAVPEEPTEGELAIGVARALEARSLTSENQALRDELDGRFSFGKIVTRDASLKSLLRVLESVAETRATVLILGETGTGKSLLARTLHQASDRKHGPYVEVNCGALPAGLLEAELFGHAKGSFTGATGDRPGRFEAADGGTIFLDEIDSAPLDLQVKLLRVVQDRLFERVGESKTRSSDVRIVAATNASLTARVADGSFREDLYWRLKVVEVSVPPLRERPSDIAPLAEAFVERFAVEYGKAVRGLTPAALGVLARGMWPGNVRQLEHALERAVLLAAQPDGVRPNAIRKLAAGDLESLDAGGVPGQAPRPAMPYRPAGDVPTYPSGPAPPPSFTPEVTLQRGLDWLEKLTGGELSLKAALEGPERMLIEGALRRHTGRRDLAAKELEINRSTLFNKMRKYDLLHMDFSVPASSGGTPTIQPDATSRPAESSGASRAPFSGVNAARTTASSTGHAPGQAQ